MILDVPADKDPIMWTWGEAVPGIGPAAAAFSQAVYTHTTLALSEFEAARLRVAQINGCLFCQDWRTDRDGEKVPDGFERDVAEWSTTEAFNDRTRLAAEYAERFTVDHHGLDQEFWDRMLAAYTQVEVIELSMCLGSWIAFGRLNHVLGIDTICTLPGHPTS